MSDRPTFFQKILITSGLALRGVLVVALLFTLGEPLVTHESESNIFTVK